MKRFIFALHIVALMAALSFGQDITVSAFVAGDDAQEISLSGPTSAEPAQEVVVRLHGTPSLDLSLPLVEQLDWLMGEQRMYAYVIRPGEQLTPLELRGELVFSAQGATMQPLIRFTVGESGENRVLVDWNTGQPQLAEHIIKVEGENGPDPIPPVPPTPPGERFVLVVEETQDRTPQEAATLAALRRYLETRQAWYRIVDPSQRPEWLLPYLAHLDSESIALPALMVSVPPGDDHDGKWLVSSTIPGRSEETIAVVEEALDRE